MSDVLAQYPGVLPYLDDSERFQNSAKEVISQDRSRYLIVTQTGATISGQLLFQIAEDGSITFLEGDTLVSPESTLKIARIRPGSYSPASKTDHDLVAAEMIAEDGKFSTANGPDHGNLACVWAMRRIVQMALQREITQTDSTNTLIDELTAGYQMENGFNESNVPVGGIIISPGAMRPGSGAWHHGHVGLMGERNGPTRTVYSNSSSKALWIRNGTVESWLQDHQGLKTFYFPIPMISGSI